MSYDISERREIEQKRNQLQDALARRGIDPDGESEDTSVETLENEAGDSPSDDVTLDTLKDDGMDRDTLKDEFAVQDRLDALNRKLDWYDRRDVTPPGNVRAKRDALAKLQEERPEGGYGCMMDMRLALGEGRR
jgi:hypothetical protein